MKTAFFGGPGAAPPAIVSSVFTRIGAVVAATSDYDASQIDNDSVLDGLNVAIALAKAARSYRATYYVDPAGPTTYRNGSMAFPFATAAAAFAAAIAAGYTSAILFLPPGATLTENVVMPSVGTNWEIACQSINRSATISGTVVCTSSVTARYRLTNIIVTGAVSGDSPTGVINILYLTQCTLSSTLTLTGTGTGTWFVLCQGLADTGNALGGSINGVVNIVGGIFARVWYFGAALTAFIIQLNDCRYLGATLTLANTVAASNTARFISTLFTQALTITGTTNPGIVTMDGVSSSFVFDRGLILTNSSLKVQSENLSFDSLIVGNTAGTFNNAATRQPKGQYEVTVTVNIITAGTLGNLIVNVTYTDLSGVAVVAPVNVGGLDIAVAGGRQSGTILFAHNGAVGLGWTITGITTPGALSANVIAAVRRRN